jgi:hypothetical protein
MLIYRKNPLTASQQKVEQTTKTCETKVQISFQKEMVQSCLLGART